MALDVDDGLAVLVIGMTLVGLGVPLSETLTNDLIIATAPPERAGAASAISETGHELGGALGTAVLGSIATAVYRGGVPTDAGSAARETLGGAVATASELPPEQATSLLDTARESFVQGMHVSAVVGALLLTYTAVQALVLLRRCTSGTGAPAMPHAG
ncbi:major facilitator superfamily protein [Saccharomonospora azurea SZMC 14600]|nr:major facilitator superfamily protein [Saccharomonospora azurea SZMC 14600]